MANHKRGSKKGEFCGLPGTPCSCGNDYIKVCEPDWAEHTFPRKVNRKTGGFVFDKKYEAHHILCVAPVATALIANSKIAPILRETKWCINAEKNMVGMPLWGHTVMWYCNISDVGGDLAAAVAPPSFADVPQHDWDHNSKNSYRHEVNTKLKEIAMEIEELEHEIDADAIKEELDNLSDEFRKTLEDRGKRAGGTHAAWQAGSAAPDSHWWAPFSMAPTAWITKRGFPKRDFSEKVSKWVNRISNAIAAGT